MHNTDNCVLKTTFDVKLLNIIVSAANCAQASVHTKRTQLLCGLTGRFLSVQ